LLDDGELGGREIGESGWIDGVGMDGLLSVEMEGRSEEEEGEHKKN
jgi:hypothetical protein